MPHDRHMLTCHLHVGMPKTGTTAIQESLARADLGPLRYYPLHGPNHRGAFVVMFESAPWNHRSQRIQGRTRQQVLALRARRMRQFSNWLDRVAREPGVEGVVFSAERIGMPGPALADAIARLKAAFEARCNRFRVYGYVRPLASYLPSHFQQSLKTGARAKLSFDRLYPDYRARFEKFDQVFGRDNVSLRLFERSRLADGDVVADLAEQLGVSLAVAPRRDDNTTLGGAGTALLYAIRRAGHLPRTTPEEVSLGDKVFRLLARLGGDGFCFDPGTVRDLAECRADDLRWIEARLGEAEGSVGDVPPAKGQVIRDEADLLALAADARSALLGLEPDAEGPDPRQVAAWVEEGLTAP